MISTQPTKLMASLFEPFDEDHQLTVLHIGPALSDTVDFFSQYRCKLYFADLFAELPFKVDPEEDGLTLEQQFKSHLDFPIETRFDVCFFWDIFNYLDARAIAALDKVLRPYLHRSSRGHGFSLHNLKTPESNLSYGIRQLDTLSVRNRSFSLPNYAPHSQAQLKSVLSSFNIDKSVLLADSRLELTLRAKG
ncbi:MAG: hypothetical protein V7711_12575 [Pseudomonadales bacterium]